MNDINFDINDKESIYKMICYDLYDLYNNMYLIS